MRAVDNGDRAVKKLVDVDVAFGKAETEFGRLDLKDKIVPAHGVVMGNGSLLFD
jgi:hypothetical protein